MTPSHEDLIFLNVLQLLHPKLPKYIREQYAHKLGSEKRLMDFKTEILTKAKTYIQEIDEATNAKIYQPPEESDTTERLAAMTVQSNRFQPRFRGSFRPFQHQQRPFRQSMRPSYRQPFSKDQPFCRLCHLSGQNRESFTSHHIGDPICPSLSHFKICWLSKL